VKVVFHAVLWNGVLLLWGRLAAEESVDGQHVLSVSAVVDGHACQVQPEAEGRLEKGMAVVLPQQAVSGNQPRGLAHAVTPFGRAAAGLTGHDRDGWAIYGKSGRGVKEQHGVTFLRY
jgi:hypothetical protein